MISRAPAYAIARDPVSAVPRGPRLGAPLPRAREAPRIVETPHAAGFPARLASRRRRGMRLAAPESGAQDEIVPLSAYQNSSPIRLFLARPRARRGAGRDPP